MFAGNFAPRGWAFCDGQLLSIAQNTALFSLLGTTYGGNGTVTFGLPDMRGRVVISPGQGPGLSYYDLGQMGGVETETLLQTQLPAHTHPVTATAQIQVSEAPQATEEPAGAFLTNTPNAFYDGAGVPGQTLGGVSSTVQVLPAGSNQPISVLQPYLAINYIICMEGIYPSRN